ncbi:MAG: hypothetical protein U0X34_11070, partial [Bacteroidia bacterium]
NGFIGQAAWNYSKTVPVESKPERSRLAPGERGALPASIIALALLRRVNTGLKGRSVRLVRS